MAENEAPERCPWCKVTPEVLSGAGYNFTVECLNETCPVSPATVGIRGRANAIKTWNTRADLAAPDAAQADREIELWLKHASPRPWRIDKDNAQGIEIVAANGDLVAVEDFGSIPTERGASFAGQIISATRANFHLMAILANRLGSTPDAVRQARRDIWEAAIDIVKQSLDGDDAIARMQGNAAALRAEGKGD